MHIVGSESLVLISYIFSWNEYCWFWKPGLNILYIFSWNEMNIVGSESLVRIFYIFSWNEYCRFWKPSLNILYLLLKWILQVLKAWFEYLISSPERNIVGSENLVWYLISSPEMNIVGSESLVWISYIFSWNEYCRF